MTTGKSAYLDELCIVEYGTRVVKKRDGGSFYPVYGGGGPTFKLDTFNRENRLLIARFGMSAQCTRFVVGKFFLNDSGLTVSPRNGTLLPRFLDYQILSLNDTIFALGKGSAQKNLDVPAFRLLPVFVPCDIKAQQRIVGILDEAFDGIAIAKANAEQNLLNASKLYNSVLENLFIESVDDCETVELSDLIDTLTDYHANGSYEVLKQNVELKDTEDFAWMVRSTDFEKNFQNEMRYITKASYDFLIKSRIFGGEIIMSKIGNAGKVYLMPEICRPCSLAMNLFLIRLKQNSVSNKYVYRYLKSECGEKQIRARLKGAATQTITKESVRSLRIPVLPRETQADFVLKLESIEIETQRLESIYKLKLAALDELKKILLHQAFSGGL